MATKKELSALTGKFLIFSRPGWWKISCVEPGCDREWRLGKRPDLHPGNLLHLLNHAAGHQNVAGGAAGSPAGARREVAEGKRGPKRVDA
jgi:hypothetical protein